MTNMEDLQEHEQALGDTELDLAVKLDADERLERLAKWDQAQGLIKNLDTAFKTQKADHDKQKADLKANADKALDAAKSGEEYRPVKCQLIGDFNTGTVMPYRLDTGEPITAHRRIMTDAERQQQLNLADNGAQSSQDDDDDDQAGGDTDPAQADDSGAQGELLNTDDDGLE